MHVDHPDAPRRLSRTARPFSRSQEKPQRPGGEGVNRQGAASIASGAPVLQTRFRESAHVDALARWLVSSAFHGPPRPHGSKGRERSVLFSVTSEWTGRAQRRAPSPTIY